MAAFAFACSRTVTRAPDAHDFASAHARMSLPRHASLSRHDGYGRPSNTCQLKVVIFLPWCVTATVTRTATGGLSMVSAVSWVGFTGCTVTVWAQSSSSANGTSRLSTALG